MRIISIALLLLVTIATSADTIQLQKLAPPSDLSGIWEAHGIAHDEDGPVPYTAIVTIKRHVDGYMCQWSAGPGSNILAIAHRDGNTFTVAWISRNMPGVSIFKLAKGEKEMTGKWMALPSATWEVESLRFVAPLPVKRKIGTT